jgi:ribosomal protein S18 acetylase RimI-like enzyme
MPVGNSPRQAVSPSFVIERLDIEATANILPQLQDLLDGAYSDSHMYQDLVEDVQQAPDPFQLFVVRADTHPDEVIGTAVVESKVHPAFNYLGLPSVHLKRFTVAESIRGMGIGKRLLDESKRYAFEELGLSAMFVESNEIGAISMYGREGALYSREAIDEYYRRNTPNQALYLFALAISDPLRRTERYPNGEGIRFVFTGDEQTTQFFRDHGYISKKSLVELSQDSDGTSRPDGSTGAIAWSTIESSLANTVGIKDGFSSAFKGIVNIPNKEPVFVKLGTDAASKEYTRKEIGFYELLAAHNYSSAPALLAYNPERTGFSLEALLPEDGWDWSDEWTEIRLEKALEAMDELTKIPVDEADKQFLNSVRTISENDGGWRVIAESTELQHQLQQSLAELGYEDFLDSLDIPAFAAEEAAFRFNNNSLVHYDVRSYNCAEKDGQVRLVDFDWVAMGDSRIATAMTLGDAHASGLDIRKQHSDKLNPASLAWAAGYWLKGSLKTGIDPANRNFKLKRGVAALRLASEQM